jgi:tetratricopeptide (TPR) repeat protein
MVISRYDEPLRGRLKDPWQNFAEAAYEQLVAAGTIKRCEKRKPDLALVEKFLAARGHATTDAPIILGQLLEWLRTNGADGVGVETLLVITENLALRWTVDEMLNDLTEINDNPLNQAQGHLGMRRFDAAIACLNGAIESGKYGAAPYWYRALAHFLKDDIAGSIGDLDRYIADGEPWMRSTAFAWRSQALLAAGRRSEAVESLASAIATLAAQHSNPHKEADGTLDEEEEQDVTVELRRVVRVTGLVETQDNLQKDERKRFAEIKIDIIRLRNSIGL